MFGLESLDALPELPRYKLDENQQIVIDDIIEEKELEQKEEKEQSESEEKASVEVEEKFDQE